MELPGQQRRLSPFGTDPSGRQLELDFLTAFELAVGAPEDGPSEGAAYAELVKIHGEAIAGMDDLAPSLMTFMEWATRELAALAAN